MKTVMSTDEYTIFQRRDGRYAVEGPGRTAINGDDKVKILLQHDLVKAPAPKEPEREVVEEVAEEVTEEAVAEEAPAEDAPTKETPAEEASAETATDDGAEKEPKA